MNILNVTASFPPALRFGGPPIAAHAVARELLRRGNRLLTLTCDLDNGDGLRGQRKGDTIWNEVPVRYCRSFEILQFFSPELGREMRHRIGEYDVCLSRGNWGYINFITRRVCAKAGTPYILYPEGSFDPWAIKYKAGRKNLWWHLVEETNYQRAAAIIALTRTEADQVRNAGVTARIEVIPNGVDPGNLARPMSRQELAACLPGLGPEPFLLFLGRLHPKKGLHYTLRALASLASHFSEWRLVIAGPDEGGYRAYLTQMVGELGLDRKVLFVGPVAGEIKSGLLKEAELFIHTSLSEGLPLAVLEAMVYGTPVLISPFCNLPEVAAAGAGVILPLEVTTIAGALAELLRDESGRLQMGLNARQLVAERFTWDRVGELTEKLCAEVAR